jgi:hypothetical protein
LTGLAAHRLLASTVAISAEAAVVVAIHLRMH